MSQHSHQQEPHPKLTARGGARASRRGRMSARGGSGKGTNTERKEIEIISLHSDVQVKRALAREKGNVIILYHMNGCPACIATFGHIKDLIIGGKWPSEWKIYSIESHSTNNDIVKNGFPTIVFYNHSHGKQGDAPEAPEVVVGFNRKKFDAMIGIRA